MAMCLSYSLTSCSLHWFPMLYEAIDSFQSHAQATMSSASATLETASTSGLDSVRTSIPLSQSSGVGVKVSSQLQQMKERVPIMDNFMQASLSTVP